MTLLRRLDRHQEDAVWLQTEASVASPPEDAIWLRPSRYSDQPTDWRTRLFGMGGVTAIALLILGGALITWQTFTAPPATPDLSVFDVEPPAAPPEPPSEVPPAPEEVQQAKPLPRPDMRVEPPLIEVPSVNPLTRQLSEQAPDPGPPVERTTAPEREPAPPAPKQSNAKPTWEGMVLAALNKAKRYPREASLRRQQGVPYIRFVMDRRGRVLSSRLERSSGFPALDEEAVGLPRRAAPLPKPPEEVEGSTIELVVPVEFFMRAR